MRIDDQFIIREFFFLLPGSLLRKRFVSTHDMEEVFLRLHFNAGEHLLDDLGISAFRNALISVIKIIVVISKAEGKSLDDEGRKFCAGTSPLLLGIALYKLLIDILTCKRECLLFEILCFELFRRLTGLLAKFCHCFSSLLLDDFLSFLRCADIPHAGEGVHVEGKIIGLILIGGYG